MNIALPLCWNPIFKRDLFFISPSNEVAFQWIHQWPWSFSHLWIFGPSGCGKTHLAKIWCDEHHALWITPHDLALVNPTHACVIDWEKIDPVHIDPIVLYRFLIRVQEKKTSCLWISGQSPYQWNTSLADVTSRIRSMMGIEIHAPDDALLKKILEKSLLDMGWKIHPRLIDFLVRRMPRSFSAVSQLTQWVRDHPLEQGLSIHHLKSLLRRIESDEAIFLQGSKTSLTYGEKQ